MQRIRTQQLSSTMTYNQKFYFPFYTINQDHHHDQRRLAKPNSTPLSFNLDKFIFKPFVIQQANFCFGQAKKGLQTKNTSLSKKSVFKWVLSLGTASILAISAKGWFMPTPNTSRLLDQVISQGELVVATTESDSTVFSEGDLNHGFGYDMANRYAEHLGVKLKMQVYDTEEKALAAVKLGNAHTMLGVSVGTDTQKSMLSCDNASASTMAKHGLNTDVGFVFAKGNQAFADNAKQFLCHDEQKNIMSSMARFYDKTLLQNDYSSMHFERALKQKLPLYEYAFKMGAKEYDHDWQLLAAVSYQESHLNPTAVSPTGVAGLMMLTNDTAKEMGVQNRTDAAQSIKGGAKYLQVLEKLFVDVPENDRLWFTLASYNMGPNAVKRIQAQINASGKNGNSWSEFYAYLTKNANTNSRYVQCMHYVANIRTYLEAIKSMDA